MIQEPLILNKVPNFGFIDFLIENKELAYKWGIAFIAFCMLGKVVTKIGKYLKTISRKSIYLVQTFLSILLLSGCVSYVVYLGHHRDLDDIHFYLGVPLAVTFGISSIVSIIYSLAQL